MNNGALSEVDRLTGDSLKSKILYSKAVPSFYRETRLKSIPEQVFKQPPAVFFFNNL